MWMVPSSSALASLYPVEYMTVSMAPASAWFRRGRASSKARAHSSSLRKV